MMEAETLLWAFAVMTADASSLGGAPPVLLHPSAGEVLRTPHPHFSWAPSCPPEAIAAKCSYQIQVKETAGSRLTHVSNTSSITTRWVPLVPLAIDSSNVNSNSFEWRVASVWDAVRADGGGSQQSVRWSDWRQFFVRRVDQPVIVPSMSTYDEIQAVIARACAGVGSSWVLFEPGTTRLLDPPANASFFATLSHCVDNVLLDFNGAALTFSRRVGFFNVTNCTGVVVRNLVLDLAPLPYSALRVDAVAGDGSSFDGTLLPRHPALESLDIVCVDGTGRCSFELVDPVTTRTARGVMETIAFSPAFQRLTPSGVVHHNETRYRVNLTAAGRGALGQRDVGFVAVFGERTGPPGFSIQGGSGATFANVTVHACANECFTSSHSPALSILGGGIVLLAGRFKAANDGGHNHHSARIGAWIEGGRWESTGDVEQGVGRASSMSGCGSGGERMVGGSRQWPQYAMVRSGSWGLSSLLTLSSLRWQGVE